MKSIFHELFLFLSYIYPFTFDLLSFSLSQLVSQFYEMFTHKLQPYRK